jgi:hypothetical protein
MRSRRAAAALALVLVVSGCGAETPGTSTINPAATVGSASSLPSAPAPAGPGPTVTTLTVTTVTTEPAPSGSAPSVASTAPPAAPTTDLSGEVYGFVTAVDPARSELTLDKIDWFTGEGARQACAQDGVTSTDNNRCTSWYFRNNNPALRVVTVAPDAAISTLDGGVRPVPGDLAAVAAAIGRHSPWRLTVSDGRVTELEQIYLP